MVVQIIQNPDGYNNRCPRCGALTDNQLVDDGEEVLLIRVCSECGHNDLERIR